MHDEIASQLVDSDVDFFAVGGIAFFGHRMDSLNYLDSLVNNGFEVDTTELFSGELDSSRKYGYLLAGDGMPKILEGRGEFLTQATRLAIDHLSQWRTQSHLQPNR